MRHIFIFIFTVTCASLMLSCSDNQITNSASTNWIGSYSGSGDLEIWNRQSQSGEPDKTIYPDRSVTVNIQEGDGLGTFFFSNLKLTLTYTQQDGTLETLSFPSSSPSIPHKSSYLHLNPDTLNTTTHSGSITYNLDLFRQGEFLAGKVESTEIQESELQPDPPIWSMSFTVHIQE